MSTVRIFNPASPSSSASGIYRPSFVVGRRAAPSVRDRLVEYGIADRAKSGRRVLLNSGFAPAAPTHRWARNDAAAPVAAVPVAPPAPPASPATAKNKPAKRRPSKTASVAKKTSAKKSKALRPGTKAAKTAVAARKKATPAVKRKLTAAQKKGPKALRKAVKKAGGVAVAQIALRPKAKKHHSKKVVTRAPKKAVVAVKANKGRRSRPSPKKAASKTATAKKTAVVHVGWSKHSKKPARQVKVPAKAESSLHGFGRRSPFKKPAAKKPAAKKAAAKKPTAKKPTAKKASSGVKLSKAGFAPKHASAVVKAPAKKASPKKTRAAKKRNAKKPSAKTAVVKAPAKKARKNKASSRKTSAKTAKSVAKACATVAGTIPSKIAAEIVARGPDSKKSRGKAAAAAAAYLKKFVEESKSAAVVKSAKKASKGARRPSSKKQSKGSQTGTAVVPVRSNPKGRKARASSASAHKAKAKKAGSTRRSDSVATKKKAKKAAKASRSKRSAGRRPKAKKKNQGAVVSMNKPKRKKPKKAKKASAKKAKSSRKAARRPKKSAKRRNQGAVVAMNKPKKKHKKAAKKANKPKTRRNDLAKVLATKGKTGDKLWATIVNKLSRKSRALKAEEKKSAAALARRAKAVEVLSTLAPFVGIPGSGVTADVFLAMGQKAGLDTSQLGAYLISLGAGAPDVSILRERITRAAAGEGVDKDLAAALATLGLTKDDIKKYRKSSARKASKRARTAVVPVAANPKKKKPKKSKSKKGGSKKGKSKKGSSKKGGSKKGKSKKGGSKKGKAKKAKSKKSGGKRRNPGFDVVKAYIPAPVQENVVNPYASVVKHQFPGAIVGGAASFLFPKTPVIGSFFQKNAATKILGSAIGGALGVGATAFLANRFLGQDAGVEMSKGAAVGALIGFLARSVNALTDATNPLRMLVGTDAANLADAVGLSDEVLGPVNVPVKPGQAAFPEGGVLINPGGSSQTATGRVEEELMDEAGAPPIGGTLSADEYAADFMDDFAAPAMGDFAAPAMGDFAAPAMGDFAAPAMADDMDDFAAPAMGDFAAPAMDDDMGEPWSGGPERGTWNH